jgi:hypothetical protein
MASAGAAAGYNIYRATRIDQPSQSEQNEQPRAEDSQCHGVPYPVTPPNKREIPKQEIAEPFIVTERPVKTSDGKTVNCDRERTFGVFVDGQQMPHEDDSERIGRRKHLWAAIRRAFRRVYMKKVGEGAGGRNDGWFAST